MIESPRKQGHFDPRYGSFDAPELAQDHMSGGESPAGLDWYAFLACYFPGRRRHDLEALKAYEAHRSPWSAPPMVRLPRVAPPALDKRVVEHRFVVVLARDHDEPVPDA
jgi:hypothetical protein